MAGIIPNYIVTETSLTNTADAIRAKTGSTDPIEWQDDGFASAIDEINPTLVTKSIVTNGTYTASADNADGYSTITVEVPPYTNSGTSAIAGVAIAGQAVCGATQQALAQIDAVATIMFVANDISVGSYSVPIGTTIETAFVYEPTIGTFNGWTINGTAVTYPYIVSESVVWVADIDLPEPEPEPGPTPTPTAAVYGVSGLGNSDPTLTRTYDNEGMTYSISTDGSGEITTDFDTIFNFEDVTDNGNSMVKIPKFYKRFDTISDDQITAFSISQSKVSDDFIVYPCFQDEDGNELDYILISKGKATGTSSLATCVKGSSPLVSVTRAQARTAAQANGSGYQQLDWSILQLIRDLFCVVFATTNSQAIFEGRINASNAATVGNTWDISTPCGWNTTTMQNKFFGIEDIFGNVLDWCDGVVFSSANIYITDKPSNYSDVTTNMNLCGTRPTSGGYITKLGYNSNYPFFNYTSAVSGSSSTYYSDYCGYYSSGTVLGVSGCWNYGSDAGLWYLGGYASGSDSGSYIGLRLAKRPM